MVAQCLHGVVAQSDVFSQLFVEPLVHITGDRFQVPEPFAQAGQSNRMLREPVIEVVPEVALLDCPVQVLVCRG
jgi:hypothetical protein